MKYSVTISDLTKEEAELLVASTQKSPAKAKAKKNAEPPKTDTSEEDEDESEDEAEDDADESDDEDESDDADEEEEDEEESVTWVELKKALNKFGNKKPKAADALLKSFKCADVKALEKNKKIWEQVYRKLQAKNKAAAK